MAHRALYLWSNWFIVSTVSVNRGIKRIYINTERDFRGQINEISNLLNQIGYFFERVKLI